MGSTDSQEVRGSTLFKLDAVDGEAGRVQQGSTRKLGNSALPGNRPATPQLWLSEELKDREITADGQARTIAGDLAEEITATISGGMRLKTDARCLVCPDIRFSSTEYLEAKSVGRSNAGIIYECRADKDAEFITRDNQSLFYWFWFHNAEVLKCKTRQELRLAITSTIHNVFIIDFPTLYTHLQTKPTKTMNTANVKVGYARGGYGIGWSISRKELEALCPLRKPLTLPRKVYGLEFIKKSTTKPSISLWMRDWSCLRFLQV